MRSKVVGGMKWAVSLWIVGGIMSVANAGYREAYSSSIRPTENVSDFYFFRSWEDPSKAIFIINVNAGQEPADGLFYHHFSEDAVYRINIDNDMDGKANDVIYEIKFNNQHRKAFGELTFPLPYVGNPNITSRPLNGITALDGPGSEGMTFRQWYTVTEIVNGRRNRLFSGVNMFAVPSNVGPLTMPDYEALAAQGIYYDRRAGMRVFAGQRADTFYGDPGALFDGSTPRRLPPIATEEEDTNDSVNPFGVNRNEGTNVHSIVLEVPVNRITMDGELATDTRFPVLGAFAGAGHLKKYRKRRDTRNPHGKNDSRSRSHRTRYIGATRVSNGLVNSFMIDVPSKDRYEQSNPKNDVQFLRYYIDPSLAKAPASEIFGVPTPPSPRLDLVSLFLKYPGQDIGKDGCGRPCADLLRLNVSVPPTAPDNQQRLGAILGSDPAGIPNGRRPNDDATDFIVRMIGGPGLIFGRIGDGVNYASGVPGAGYSDGIGYGSVSGNRLDVTDNGIVGEFPFMPTPHNGRTHRHHQESGPN